LRYAEDALGRGKVLPKLAQAADVFFKVRDELVVGSNLDDHVIHVGFHITVLLVSEA
jgi:hypothetical protein